MGTIRRIIGTLIIIYGVYAIFVGIIRLSAVSVGIDLPILSLLERESEEINTFISIGVGVFALIIGYAIKGKKQEVV